MSRISILSGGHWEEKGYNYSIFFNLPNIVWKKKISYFRQSKPHVHTILEFPTYFLLTRNNIYFNIGFSILGFGLGLEIHSRG